MKTYEQIIFPIYEQGHIDRAIRDKIKAPA